MRYVVKKGDTLSQIAERYHRNAHRWYDIFMRNSRTILNYPGHATCMRMNPKSHPADWIFPGQVLYV